MRPLDAEPVEQRDEVTGQVVNCIGAQGNRRGTVAAHVISNDPEAPLERGELGVPHPVRGSEGVRQDHDRAVVAAGDGRFGIQLDPDRAERAETLEAGVYAGILVTVDHGIGLAALARYRDGHKLVGELPGLVCGDGAVVGAHR